MTLARVGYDYPVDDVVQYFLNDPDDWDFGTKRLNQFKLEGYDDVYNATEDDDTFWLSAINILSNI